MRTALIIATYFAAAFIGGGVAILILAAWRLSRLAKVLKPKKPSRKG